MASGRVANLGEPRWRGQRHRLEVWYATFTDTATGDGYWLHHEVVAPADDAARPYAHGWLSTFPVDGPPTTERFGPAPPGDKGWFSAGDVLVEHGALRGPHWDLTFDDGSPPLYTFPKLAWDRELLPAAQIVPCPTATFRGTVNGVQIDDGRGALARIYGHGSAERWAWLHADLGDGDLIEIVAAAPRKRGPINLRPLPVVRLRVAGQDWPRGNNLTNAVIGRASIGLPRWSIAVRTRRRRLRAVVLVPPERSVALTYVDPDGSTPTCTNSERASAEITLESYDGGWRTERHWSLEGTAHAEVGTR
jgi:hypothetical protein